VTQFDIHFKNLLAFKKTLKKGANLINVLMTFLKPACILIFSWAFFPFFTWGSKKASSPRTLYIIQCLNLGLKPQGRVTNKRLELGQASVEAKAL